MQPVTDSMILSLALDKFDVPEGNFSCYKLIGIVPDDVLPIVIEGEQYIFVEEENPREGLDFQALRAKRRNGIILYHSAPRIDVRTASPEPYVMIYSPFADYELAPASTSSYLNVLLYAKNISEEDFDCPPKHKAKLRKCFQEHSIDAIVDIAEAEEVDVPDCIRRASTAMGKKLYLATNSYRKGQIKAFPILLAQQVFLAIWKKNH